MWMTSSPVMYQWNSNSRHKIPWLTNKLRHMCRKKLRLYNHARKLRKEHHWSTYKSHKKSTTKALNKAQIDYINSILQAGLDEGNSKPFWCYIFSQRNDLGSVAALKEDGKLHTGRQKKAEILNKQFTSVFSVDKLGRSIRTQLPTYRQAADQCSRSWEASDRNKPQQGCGPRPSTLPHTEGALYNLSTSVSCHIYQITIETSTLPSAWKTAFVSPIFKKGATCQAENYRPVSLTCITCKMLAWTHHLPPCEKPPGQAWHLVSTATWVQIRAFMWHSFLPPCTWPVVYKGLWLSDWRHCAWL